MKHKKALGILLLSLAILGGCSTHKKTESKRSKTEQSTQTNSKSTSSSTSNSESESTSETSTDTSATDSSTSQSDSPVTEQDLDINAISNDDISTLVGTWQNSNGDTITINADKTLTTTSTNGQYSGTIATFKNNNAKIPSVSANFATTGVSIGLFKINFKNPYGDQSDSSRPRIVESQNQNNYSPDAYYYRQ